MPPSTGTNASNVKVNIVSLRNLNEQDRTVLSDLDKDGDGKLVSATLPSMLTIILILMLTTNPLPPIHLIYTIVYRGDCVLHLSFKTDS
jgi:hypothetical protein